ncbi:response regulator transcription factor [Taibaiella soli]|uniref:DNA-binding response regulator n=1 Tax=Taibaiella soli TaxID=1649169 RepID=A0A2W2BG37_9BACT|nr:response regulator transcription factor [Taibaiella soli]PZF74877.1 DNA-binding response regulator [Taibaiella soli]
MQLSIALIDDHKMFTDTLSHVLGQHEFIASIKVYASAKDFLQNQDLTNTDIIVTDIAMPGMSGLDLFSALEQKGLQQKLILLSSITDAPTIKNVLRRGVGGYVSKGAPLTELSKAIQAVYYGEQYIGSELKDILIKSSFAEEQMTYDLSPQQKEVLRLVCSGKTVKEIAFEMKLSINTVQTYYRNIMKKFKVNRTVDLILLAVQNGYVPSRT